MTTTTPTGQPGIRITCTNAQHRHVGPAAVIRATDEPLSQDRMCKLIDAAHHPLAKAASVQRFGPWPDPDCGNCGLPDSAHCHECRECPTVNDAADCWCATEADPLLAV